MQLCAYVCLVLLFVLLFGPCCSEEVEQRRPTGKHDLDEGGKWTVVERKKAKAPKDREQRTGGEARPTLALRKQDWDVPITQVHELRHGEPGIALATQAEGEQAFNELLEAEGKLAVVTPRSIDAKNSSEFQCKVQLPDGRLTVVKRWITQLGDSKVKPTYLRNVAVLEADLGIQNLTTKLVITLTADFMAKATYAKAKQHPRRAILDWLAEMGAAEATTAVFQPVLKQANGREWIEGVIITKTPHTHKIWKISGNGGVFARPFVTEGKRDTTKVVWLEKDTCLAHAHSMIARVGDEGVRGLAYSRGKSAYGWTRQLPMQSRSASSAQTSQRTELKDAKTATSSKGYHSLLTLTRLS